MLIGDVLIAQGLVTPADVEAALERQRSQGGILGEHLIAMGKLDPADLERVMQSSPPSPRNIEETGLDLPDLLNLVAKAMYSGAEMPSVIGGILKLPQRVVQLVLDQAKERKMLDVLGSTGAFAASELRYALTEKGRQWAIDAMAQNQYLGPAPVPLSALVERIQRQRITNERVDREAVEQGVRQPDRLGGVHPPRRPGDQFRPLDPALRPARQRQDVGRGADRLDLQGHDLHSLLLRGRRADHQGLRSRHPQAHRAQHRRRDARHAASRGFRPALGALPPALHRHRRRADARDARSELQRAGEVLRGAAAHQGARRHLHHRRFRPPAGQPGSAAEPLDRAARKPRRISEAPHRKELFAAVRRARRVLHQPRAARPDGPGVPAPHSLQDGDRRPDAGGVPKDLQARRARPSTWTRPTRSSTT